MAQRVLTIAAGAGCAVAVLFLLRRRKRTHFYPIGAPGSPWGESERAAWLQRASRIRRSYKDEVLARLEPLKNVFDVVQYGALPQDPVRYPLFCVKTRAWDASKPSVLVTGGVHGYETSGVQGALLFLDGEAQRYSDRFNLVVCPCVSPWGYETIQRWTASAQYGGCDSNRGFAAHGAWKGPCVRVSCARDPNREFVTATRCEETAAVMALVASLDVAQWTMHCDLHETTDSDVFEFRPAKASRDGLPLAEESIPDGFYLIGDSESAQLNWLAAIVDAVRTVTHIAPPDANGLIIGERVVQEGVILTGGSGKGKGVTNATFRATTEVYPDSKVSPVTSEQCNRAQVCCITAGLDYIIASKSTSEEGCRN